MSSVYLMSIRPPASPRPVSYTHLVNVLVDMMLPQRATLFGWAVLFPALYLLCRAVYQGQRRCFFLVGLMAGALPMIHTHSFLALGLVLSLIHI